MNHLVRPILSGFENASFLVDLQLQDLKDTDAVRRARGDAGSSISWIVGHLLSFRCSALQACGADQPNPYEEKFSFQSPATDGSDYPPVADLRRDWSQIGETLRDTLTGLDEARLLAASPLPGPPGDDSLLAALSFYQWHEAYHVGTIGMLRVEWGYRHTHELAMAAKG